MHLGNSSPKKAWEYLKRAAVKDDEMILYAHQLAHTIGNITYRRNGINGIALCDPTFSFGCYHGVTEELLRQSGPRSIAYTLNQCRQMFPGENNYAKGYARCIHGMGHGLLIWEEFNLQKALLDCDLLEEIDRRYCYDGVFMEYAFSNPEKNVFDDNPWIICTTLDERYRPSCARYLPSILETTFNPNLSKIADICLSAPTDTLRNHCIDHLGFLVWFQSKNDVKKVNKLCSGMRDDEYKYQCIARVAEELIFQKYQGWRKNAPALCQTLPEEWRKKCSARNQKVIESEENIFLVPDNS